MSLKHHPRRSLRQQGVARNAVIDEVLVNENDSQQNQGSVASVLGSDLAEEEEDGEQPATTEVDVEREEEAATEVDVQPSTEETRTQQTETKKRKTRGRTRMSKVAKHIQDKIEVEFTSTGEHVAPGSITLSSFLGPLVREHVSVLLDDWRKLSEETSDTLWEEIQARFNLKEDYQKDTVFKQMGTLWRASKSRLVTAVRAANSKIERLKLKPSNIQSVTAWNAWVKIKTSSDLKVKSDKYRNLRKAQIPHTTSRKGMSRLAHEMKKNSSDPKQVTRSKVWVAGHTHSDGRSVRPEFAETIEKIRSIDSDMGSTTTTTIRGDAVSQVLGKDKPGRVRGLGRGVTATKLAFLQVSDSQVETLRMQIEALQQEVRNLAGKKRQSDDGSVSEDSDVSRGVSCRLLDWCAQEDVVVGEAEYLSMDPMYKIGRILLGPNAAAVMVKSVSREAVSVWRPTETITSLVEAVGVKIAWPADKIVLHTEMDSPSDKATDSAKCFIYDWNMDDVVIGEGRLCSTDPKELVNNMPTGQGAAIVTVDDVFTENVNLWRPISADILTIGKALHEKIVWPIKHIELFSSEQKESSPQKQTSSKSLTNSDGSSGSTSKKKCILLDCNDSEKEVAVGRVLSTNPSEKVHFVPLGNNASKIMVEVVKVGEAKVWKPNAEIETIADAIGTTVAWPNDKLVFV